MKARVLHSNITLE